MDFAGGRLYVPALESDSPFRYFEVSGPTPLGFVLSTNVVVFVFKKFKIDEKLKFESRALFWRLNPSSSCRGSLAIRREVEGFRHDRS